MIHTQESREQSTMPTADAARRIADRLSAQGFFLKHRVPAEEQTFREYLTKVTKAPSRFSAAELGGDYLFYGKKFTYSPLSVIGYIETGVLVASISKVRGELIRPFSDRAFVTAVCRKTRFVKIFPVVLQQIIPILLADESDASVEEYFSTEKPRFDPVAKAICYPVVCGASDSKFIMHRKLPTVAGLHFAAAKKFVEELLS